MVLRSAETMQRLMERESVQLVVADSYSTCAAAVAEMHDIPVLLMHNSGFPQVHTLSRKVFLQYTRLDPVQTNLAR